jgi:hypothetical protein
MMRDVSSDRVPDIDFARIRPYGQPASRSSAFEELASILIEQGAVEWPNGVSFSRFGNPDGGRWVNPRVGDSAGTACRDPASDVGDHCVAQLGIPLHVVVTVVVDRAEDRPGELAQRGRPRRLSAHRLPVGVIPAFHLGWV